MSDQQTERVLRESDIEEYKEVVAEYDPRNIDKTELFFATVIGLLSGYTAAGFIIQVVL